MIYFPSLREQFREVAYATHPLREVAYATHPRPLVLAVGDFFADSLNIFTRGC